MDKFIIYDKIRLVWMIVNFMLGYTKKLYILPFDHRGSFLKVLFGKRVGLDDKEKKMVKEYRKIVFEGFLKVWAKLGMGDSMGVLIDAEYGSDLIKKAKRKKIITAMSVEKSGRKDFQFEDGKDFGDRVLKIDPVFVKALVRYNPRDKEKNAKQLDKLKVLSDWCRENEYKLMMELLVPAGDADLRKVRGSKEKYDLKIRPELTIKAINEFYEAGIEPDLWKIEAMETKEAWKEVIGVIRGGNARKDVGIIMLGRGESTVKVADWIDNCPKEEVNGFAIGRTIWLRSILDLHNNKINKREAVKQISENYMEIIELWIGGKDE